MENKLDVTGQIILGAIPAVIPQLYAFYKIKKLRKGVLIWLVTTGIIILENIMDMIAHWIIVRHMVPNTDPSSQMVEAMVGIIVASLLPMYFVRKWTIEYNEKIVSQTS